MHAKLNICRHLQIIYDIVSAQIYVFYHPKLTSFDRTCMVSFFYAHPELTTDVAQVLLARSVIWLQHSCVSLNPLSC